jgi:hypothetical protein
MALARWLIVFASSLAAAVIIVVIYMPTLDKCSAAPLIVEDPIAAFISADPGYPLVEDRPPGDYLGGPCGNENWWGPVTVWLLIWGPMCAALIGAGYVSARHGGSSPLQKSAVAGAFAVALVLGSFLTLMRIYSGAVPTRLVLNSIALVCASGAISTIGAFIWRRHA